MCGALVYHWKVVIPFADNGLLPQLTDVMQRVLLASGVLFFDLLEVDRVIGQSQREQAKQLSHGFQGSIEHATCSKAADTARILQEIGDRTSDVDYAIHVLLAAGMSTPTLRSVARAGVDISGAGYTEMAFPCLDLGPFLIHGLLLVLRGVLLHRCYRWIPCLVSLCARLVLLFSLWRSARDERCFILKMMAKMVALMQIIILPTVTVLQLTASEMDCVFYAITIFIMLAHIITVGFACLGMQRLANLPFAGPCMLQLFLGRGHCCVASAAGAVPVYSPSVSAVEHESHMYSSSSDDSSEQLG
eukprot:s1052_g6.t1